MADEIAISIIICTHNRACDLEQTLCSLRAVALPKTENAELIVVDNGSTDGTARTIKSFHRAGLAVHYVYEGRRGKGYAYNAGISAARGRVLLFSDDDIRFPRDWIQGMCAPILAGESDALAGGVRIAKHLERPWMEAEHRLWMAHTESLSNSNFEMVGANMSFGRHILSKVPAFDPELGPGASGLGDDTLMHLQIVRAGYRVRLQQDVSVEHHFDPSRLRREAFLRRAEAMGRSLGYLAYHWEHRTLPLPMLRLIKAKTRLQWYRTVNRPPSNPHGEGAPLSELSRLTGFYFYEQYLRERERPRNYERYGLMKLHS